MWIMTKTAVLRAQVLKAPLQVAAQRSNHGIVAQNQIKLVTAAWDVITAEEDGKDESVNQDIELLHDDQSNLEFEPQTPS